MHSDKKSMTLFFFLDSCPAGTDRVERTGSVKDWFVVREKRLEMVFV